MERFEINWKGEKVATMNAEDAEHALDAYLAKTNKGDDGHYTVNPYRPGISTAEWNKRGAAQRWYRVKQ